MSKAEEYFWENLPKRNLTSQNVIDRERVNFDDIINLMEQYADEERRENMGQAFIAGGRKAIDPRKYPSFTKWFDNWFNQQEESHE